MSFSEAHDIGIVRAAAATRYVAKLCTVPDALLGARSGLVLRPSNRSRERCARNVSAEDPFELGVGEDDVDLGERLHDLVSSELCLHKTKPLVTFGCVSSAETTPNWDRLFDFAVGQEGHFTTQQAAQAGYSPQLLQKYLKNGRIVRVRRGVYRIVHFPAAEHEDLATIWLWSEREGVFSHQTALMLHDLSDVLPRKMHITLPGAWAKRRFRVPKGVVLHHAEIAASLSRNVCSGLTSASARGVRTMPRPDRTSSGSPSR